MNLHSCPLFDIDILNFDLIKPPVAGQAQLHGQQLWTPDAAMPQKIPGCADCGPVGEIDPQQMLPFIRVHAAKTVQANVVDSESLHTSL